MDTGVAIGSAEHLTVIAPADLYSVLSEDASVLTDAIEIRCELVRAAFLGAMLDAWRLNQDPEDVVFRARIPRTRSCYITIEFRVDVDASRCECWLRPTSTLPETRTERELREKAEQRAWSAKAAASKGAATG